MRNKPDSFYIGVASFIYGILVFLFVYQRDQNYIDAILAAFVFSIIIFLIVLLLHTKLVSKLKIFGGAVSIIIQSALYIFALTFTILTTFIVYTFYHSATDQFENLIVDGFIKGFLYIVTLPFAEQQLVLKYSPEFQNLLFTFFILIFLIALISIISSYVEVRWRETKQNQLVTDAELRALQAQIEPHFLFNSLNTIVSIVKSDPEKAEDLLIKFSELLHHIFSASNRVQTTLAEEINFLKNYLSLMQERFFGNLHVEWKEDIKDYDLKVPALVCQPLVENAIKHGWQDKSKKFELTISIFANTKYIECMFKDNGTGINAGKLKLLPEKGHALYNLTERLYLEYQEKNLLKINSEKGIGTTINLKIPVRS